MNGILDISADVRSLKGHGQLVNRETLTSSASYATTGFRALPTAAANICLIRKCQGIGRMHSGARSRRPLGDELHLNGFSAQRASGSTGDIAVLCPIEPAKTFRMDPVINVEMIGNLTRKFDLQSLNRSALTSSARNASVRLPTHPTDSGNMRLIADGPGIFLVAQGDLESFEALRFPHGSRRLPRSHRRHPAIAFRMCLIIQSAPAIRTRSAPGGTRALGNQSNLNSLDLIAGTKRAGRRTIRRPTHPADIRNMHTIEDVIASGQVTSKTEPQCLQRKSLASSSNSSISNFGLPARMHHIGLADNGTANLR